MPASTFLSVFAKSPIKPIEEHIRKVHQASELLLPFFDAVYAQDWQAAADVRKNIVALEKEADKLKREIRVNLPRGLFLPVDRTDILELVSQQDKIANKTKDITGRVLGRELLIPVGLQAGFKAYVQRCIDATALASEPPSRRQLCSRRGTASSRKSPPPNEGSSNRSRCRARPAV